MKLKLLTIVGLLITLNVGAEPVTNDSIDKAFVGSTEVVTYKTNTAMEGFVGMGVGFANATEPLLGDFASKQAETNTKLITMDKESSTAFNTGKVIGTASTTLVGVEAITARASIIASKAVTKAAGEITEQITNMAIKQNNTNKVIEETMELEKLSHTAMEKAANKISDAADALKAQNQ